MFLDSTHFIGLAFSQFMASRDVFSIGNILKRDKLITEHGVVTSVVSKETAAGSLWLFVQW